MLFLPTLRCLWWFGSYNLHKLMMDFQENLEGWLEDATLFLNKPINALFNIHDVTSGKANDDVGQQASILPDLGLEGEGWLDEMVCILDYPNDSLNLHNEAETLMVGEAANILESLVDTNFDASYLPLELNDNTGEEFKLSFEDCQTETNSESPLSPIEHQPSSPVSSIGSPGSSCYNGSQSDSSVSVTVYSPPEQALDSEEKRVKPLKIAKVFNLDELSFNVEEKLQSSRGKIPSVHVSLKPSARPYEKRPKRESKYERKKVQNKEAAARYRIKKRMEEKEASDVVSGLKEQQKDLQEKHDQLEGEIKYLKSLMREMFKAKGML